MCRQSGPAQTPLHLTLTPSVTQRLPGRIPAILTGFVSLPLLPGHSYRLRIYLHFLLDRRISRTHGKGLYIGVVWVVKCVDSSYPPCARGEAAVVSPLTRLHSLPEKRPPRREVWRCSWPASPALTHCLSCPPHSPPTTNHHVHFLSSITYCRTLHHHCISLVTITVIYPSSPSPSYIPRHHHRHISLVTITVIYPSSPSPSYILTSSNQPYNATHFRLHYHTLPLSHHHPSISAS
ncbi:hypothetical protein Pcinc_029984 [Petrolisthes cinctipes]|uniref:Uncharacterized protein n=1 Tax=Petrolisthes cinctipes TaxID=88211 RepID=A0AAE1K386_PETCI|nr:hypothetical protein Pcinc_029984 [Petrolisthes cinctipes]